MNYTFVKNEEWQEAMLNGTKWRFPTTWLVAPLGDIAETVTGNTPSTTNKKYWAEKVGTPWFSTPDFRQQERGYVTKSSRLLTDDGVNVARMCPVKTLLVSCIATIGEVSLLSEVSSFNQQINGVLPNEKIDTAYFRQWFIYRASEFKRFAPTSVVPIINKSLFNKFEVIIPPLEEQTAIANILSDQEILIAHYDNLIALHEKRFAYLSAELLSGRLRLKFHTNRHVVCVENEDWVDISLNGEIALSPLNWTPKAFNQLGAFKTGKDHKKCPGTEYFVYGSSKKPMAVKTAKSIYDRDTFIIGRKGTIDQPFKVKGPFWCVDTAMYFAYTQDTIDIEFLYQQAKQIPWIRYNTGSTMPSLNQSQVNDLEVLVPPLEEQRLIANVLSDQEALIAQYKTLRNAEKKRFDWLSDALLSGTYRVKVEE